VVVKVTLRGIVTVNSITERNAQCGLQIKVQGLILRGNESSEVTLGLISCYPCEEKKIQMQFFCFPCRFFRVPDEPVAGVKTRRFSQPNLAFELNYIQPIQEESGSDRSSQNDPDYAEIPDVQHTHENSGVGSSNRDYQTLNINNMNGGTPPEAPPYTYLNVGFNDQS